MRLVAFFPPAEAAGFAEGFVAAADAPGAGFVLAGAAVVPLPFVAGADALVAGFAGLAGAALVAVAFAAVALAVAFAAVAFAAVGFAVVLLTAGFFAAGVSVVASVAAGRLRVVVDATLSFSSRQPPGPDL